MFKRVYDNSIGPLILQWGDMISGLVGTIIDGFNNHVNPILEKVGKAFSDVYDQFVKPMIDSLGNASRALWKL